MTINQQSSKGEEPVLFQLRKAQQMVVSSPEILGGVPVFRGTRVLVHIIADMVTSGVPVSEILVHYPTLTEEQVRLSTLATA